MKYGCDGLTKWIKILVFCCSCIAVGTYLVSIHTQSQIIPEYKNLDKWINAELQNQWAAAHAESIFFFLETSK